MSKKIKAVDIVSEEVNEEAKTEEAEEQPNEEEALKVDTPKNDDDEKITEIINEEKPKSKPNRKMITCPDCNKTMLERNFRYQHINVCGKVNVPKPRAKPIEEVIKEKREKAKAIQEESQTPKPAIQRAVTQPELTEAPKPVDFWTLRKEYANQLRERRTILAKKLVSKAF